MTTVQSTFIKNIDLFIIDECSLLNKKNLARVDIIFRRVRNCDLPFGGCHKILSGDFFQLPPATNGLPLYVNILMHTKPTVEEITGYELWKNITQIIILTENNRQIDDIEWAEGCRNARKGIWTNQFVEIINSRLVPDLSLANLFDDEITSTTKAKAVELVNSLNEFEIVPFITPSNDRRNVIINEFTKQCSAQLPPGDYPIRLYAKFGFQKKRKQAGKFSSLKFFTNNKI